MPLSKSMAPLLRGLYLSCYGICNFFTLGNNRLDVMSHSSKNLVLFFLLLGSSICFAQRTLDDLYLMLQRIDYTLAQNTSYQLDADMNVEMYIDESMSNIHFLLDEIYTALNNSIYDISANTDYLSSIDDSGLNINDNILACMNQLESIRFSVEDLYTAAYSSLNHLVANSDFFVNNWPPNYQAKLDEIKQAIAGISAQFRQEPFISVNVPGLSVVVDALQDVADQISSLDIDAIKAYLDSIDNYNRRQTNYQLEIGHVLVGYTNMFGQLIGFIPDAYDEHGNLRKDVVRQIARDSVDLGTNAPPAVDYSKKDMDTIKTNIEHLVSSSDSQDSDGRTLLNEWRVHQVRSKVDNVLSTTENRIYNLADSVDLPNQIDNYEIRGIRFLGQELETFSLNTSEINNTRSITESYVADIVYRLLQYATVVFLTMKITRMTLKDLSKNPAGV